MKQPLLRCGTIPRVDRRDADGAEGNRPEAEASGQRNEALGTPEAPQGLCSSSLELKLRAGLVRGFIPRRPLRLPLPLLYSLLIGKSVSQ